ncbi:phosphoglucosamine mutase [Capsulimonas corticalis]|uniref:Phosphoglucosamine mutase n=1 Tax=Capsulimonas corticalis TaxID=2219043 RepID=A0A402D230_9BACT|nr:phosphoglucosamine mutase [Capsulimonas corticalis]BDI30154.1 phosphoglucosamine mutase [Capsulimonas corticalis]
MSEKLFGTDGVRGVANTELTPSLAFALGAAAARVLGRSHTPKFVIGRDTRISGTLLEAGITAGLCSMGATVVSPGVVPTPAVANIARTAGFDAGVVISASHNPYQDNGIKFFGADGYKLDDAIEAEIEALVPQALTLPRPSGALVGVACRDPHLRDIYAEHMEETMNGLRLDGIKIVIDAANGANHEIGPRVATDLGASVIALHCAPNGININAGCGSLHPGEMRANVIEHGAQIGIAFDGDADRVILADEQGRLVDGDRVMMIVGRHLAKRGQLARNTVVGTIMSNMGLEVALREGGVTLLRTAVGDRYVCEEMRREGYILGGEKSGHLIFGHLTTTGDGLLTALQVLKVMCETGQPLSALADQMSEYPQTLLGVRVTDRTAWQSDDEIQRAIAQTEEKLTGRGRLNVRASGTEKLIRIMAEGPDQSEIEELAGELASLVKKKYGVAE